MKLNKKDFNWTKKAVIGHALLLMGGSIDSTGTGINGSLYYEVGKHKESGKVILFPTIQKSRIPE